MFDMQGGIFVILICFIKKMIIEIKDQVARLIVQLFFKKDFTFME